MIAPFQRHEIIMDGAFARIIKDVVDQLHLPAALNQRIALHIMSVEIAINKDLAGIVVDQRALAMLALGMAGLGQSFGRDIVGEGDGVAGVAAPIFGCFPFKTRAGGGHIFIDRPGEAAMTDVGITGGKKGNNMLYISGVQKEKIFTEDMISKVIDEVEKKAAELENN